MSICDIRHAESMTPNCNQLYLTFDDDESALQLTAKSMHIVVKVEKIITKLQFIESVPFKPIHRIELTANTAVCRRKQQKENRRISTCFYSAKFHVSKFIETVVVQAYVRLCWIMDASLNQRINRQYYSFSREI